MPHIRRHRMSWPRNHGAKCQSVFAVRLLVYSSYNYNRSAENPSPLDYVAARSVVSCLSTPQWESLSPLHWFRKWCSHPSVQSNCIYSLRLWLKTFFLNKLNTYRSKKGDPHTQTSRTVHRAFYFTSHHRGNLLHTVLCLSQIENDSFYAEG